MTQGHIPTLRRLILRPLHLQERPNDPVCQVRLGPSHHPSGLDGVRGIDQSWSIFSYSVAADMSRRTSKLAGNQMVRADVRGYAIS
jgi:hypothetical protein